MIRGVLERTRGDLTLAIVQSRLESRLEQAQGAQRDSLKNPQHEE